MSLIDDAEAFLRTHARLIDRRRFALRFRGAGPDGALAALAAYRDDDGGFGWGLEPDLRAPGSQPAGALHALEVLEETGPGPEARTLAVALCDWLDAATLPDGGLPFALAGAEGPGTAPWWAGADPSASSLHITAAVCEQAWRVAAHDDAVAGHRWLERATAFCRAAIAARRRPEHAYEHRYVLALLDVLAARGTAGAAAELDRMVALLPPDLALPVEGGTSGETLRPLVVSARPDGPLRERLDARAIADDLDRLLAERRDDGGWDVDFAVQSPAAALAWRGYATVGALRTLADHDRLTAS